MQNEKILKLFNEYGVDLSLSSLKQVLRYDTVGFEPPVRISESNFFHHSVIGAFSYMVSGSVYNTNIGRYCSIASGVNIGQGNHPYKWLSTSPFQYEQSFRFKTGPKYKYHDMYQKYKVPENNRRKALDSIRKPKTIIGNDVWIGTNAIVLPGVRIGNGAIIGAGCIVTKDVPDYAIIAGNPGKVIKYRFNHNIINRLIKLKWWNYSPWDLHRLKLDFNDIESSMTIIEHAIRVGELMEYNTDILSVEELVGIYMREYK